ncbi:MAG TPA: dienelactone hydrolase family protein [Burkholderiaceae bacterium]
MLSTLRALLRAGVCSLAFMAAAQAAPVEAVHFDSLDGTELTAWLALPPQMPPRGTVIALHGCGGLYATSGPRKGRLNARHQGMTDMLVAQGYAVLLPDSLTPRGEHQICTQKIGSRHIDQTQRRVDGLAALDWVAAQPWADARKIAVLGWSHGGTAVLSVTDAANTEVARHANTNPGQFAVAIAFYPGCSAALRHHYQPGTRLVMQLGADDDWTPPQPCIDLAHQVGAEVDVYPDSYHDFDNPIGTVRMRKDVPNGIHPGQGVHAGRNPEAAAQAWARVREVLARAFQD